MENSNEKGQNVQREKNQPYHYKICLGPDNIYLPSK